MDFSMEHSTQEPEQLFLNSWLLKLCISDPKPNIDSQRSSGNAELTPYHAGPNISIRSAHDWSNGFPLPHSAKAGGRRDGCGLRSRRPPFGTPRRSEVPPR